MDDLDLRILNLERLVFRLQQQIASTSQRALANSTLLNNSGPMAGAPPATGGSGGGSCPAPIPSGPIAITAAHSFGQPIPANGHIDFAWGGVSTCVIRIYNLYSVDIPSGVDMLLTPAPDLGPYSYVATRGF